MAYLYRILKFALQDLNRNFWLSVVTISILILTLLTIDVLVVFNAMADTTVRAVEDKIDVSIEFKASATDKEIEEMHDYILSLPETKEVEYVSREEVLADFKAAHEGNKTILEVLDELGENPLGVTLHVKATSFEGYAAILEAVSKAEFNEIVAAKDYRDCKTMVDKITGWTKTGQRVVLVFILFFSVISALIVFNTIRVAIYTHREEIGIQKLVGATNWFTSLPFIVGSVIYGLVALVIATAVLYPLLNLVQPHLAKFFGEGQFDVVSYFNFHFIAIFGLEFIVITLLNVVSSFVATRRYLKV